MTQKAHHTEEILAEYDLTSIDGYILASFCYIPPLTGGFLAHHSPTHDVPCKSPPIFVYTNVHLYWQDLGWDCSVSVFAIFKELLPLIYVRISFLLNIRRMNGWILI